MGFASEERIFCPNLRTIYYATRYRVRNGETIEQSNIERINEVFPEEAKPLNAAITLKSHHGGHVSEPAIFSIGGFTVINNGRQVSFDWVCTRLYTCTVKDGFLEIYAELEGFDVDAFMESWEEIGLHESDITPQFLTESEAIDEVFFECFKTDVEEGFIPLDVVSFSLYSGSAEYQFTPEQLEAVNIKQLGEASNRTGGLNHDNE